MAAGVKYFKTRTGCIVIRVGTMRTRNAQNEMAPMSKLPDWSGRIPLIRAALTDITTEFIDKRQIGELFGVSSDRARRLIHDMGPMRHGNSLVVDAEDIRKMLSEMERDQEIRDLRRRLAEKEAEVEQASRTSKTR